MTVDQGNASHYNYLVYWYKKSVSPSSAVFCEFNRLKPKQGQKVGLSQHIPHPSDSRSATISPLSSNQIQIWWSATGASNCCRSRLWSGEFTAFHGGWVLEKKGIHSSTSLHLFQTRISWCLWGLLCFRRGLPKSHQHHRQYPGINNTKASDDRGCRKPAP